MAKSETFILVSLEDAKARELAQLVANKTCRLILDYLGSKEEATESEMATALNLPISTLHYNIQNLLQHNLVESKEFMWSPKGRKMDIFRVAKKLIIIAPKGDTENIKQRLKGLLPVALVSIAAAGLIHFVQRLFSGIGKMSFAATEAQRESVQGLVESAPLKAAAYPAATEPVAPYALWFFWGALFAIIVMAIYYAVSGWRKRL